MSFLHPGLAVAAVASVALPIVIHLLFRRRRVPIDWAAMELLREAIKRTNRRLRLEQWLLLTLRCLCVLAAGLAIAAPLFDQTSFDALASRTWVVVLDNSATSGLMVGTGTELDRLRDEVRRAVGVRGVGDRIGIVSAAVPPQLLLSPTADRAQFEQELSRVESQQTPADLAGAILLARSTATMDGENADGNSAPPRILVASGFRLASLRDGHALRDNTTNDPTALTPSLDRVEYFAVAPAQDAPSDVRITDVDSRPTPSGEAVSIRIQLAREGSNLPSAQTRVRATGDGFVASPVRVTQWEPGQSESSIEVQVLLQGGTAAEDARKRGITITLEDDALRPGNTAYCLVDVRRETEIGIIGRRGSLDGTDLDKVPASLWISRALAPGTGSGMRVRDLDPATCDARALLALDAVVVARPDLLSQAAGEAIGGFVRQGGLVIVLPAGDTLTQTWAGSLLPRLGVTARIDAEASTLNPPQRLSEEQPASVILTSLRPELSALLAPIEVARKILITNVSASDVALTFADGSPFLVVQSPDVSDATTARGCVVFLSSTPELLWTNLPVKPLMVPLFQELVRAGLQFAVMREAALVGHPIHAHASTTYRSESQLTLTTDTTGVSTSIAPIASIWRSEEGGAVVTKLDPASLAIAPNTTEAVRAAFSSMGGVQIAAIADAGEQTEAPAGTKWSAVFFTIALALLCIEGVLSRLFSHASLQRAGRADSGITAVGRVRGRVGARARGARQTVGGAT